MLLYFRGSKCVISDIVMSITLVHVYFYKLTVSFKLSESNSREYTTQ